ncbi:MAG TPA: hypothetical protein VFJ85_19885 [Acidimicrobiales bacterium]|nr:hypothetical protein [Acidimicrobiales bacterium]
MATDHYEVGLPEPVLPFDDVALELVGGPPPGDPPPSKTIPYSQIDGDGIPVRLDALTDFHDFGTEVKVEPPSTEDPAQVPLRPCAERPGCLAPREIGNAESLPAPAAGSSSSLQIRPVAGASEAPVPTDRYQGGDAGRTRTRGPSSRRREALAGRSRRPQRVRGADPEKRPS